MREEKGETASMGDEEDNWAGCTWDEGDDDETYSVVSEFEDEEDLLDAIAGCLGRPWVRRPWLRKTVVGGDGGEDWTAETTEADSKRVHSPALTRAQGAEEADASVQATGKVDAVRVQKETRVETGFAARSLLTAARAQAKAETSARAQAAEETAARGRAEEGEAKAADRAKAEARARRYSAQEELRWDQMDWIINGGEGWGPNGPELTSVEQAQWEEGQWRETRHFPPLSKTAEKVVDSWGKGYPYSSRDDGGGGGEGRGSVRGRMRGGKGVGGAL